MFEQEYLIQTYGIELWTRTKNFILSFRQDWRDDESILNLVCRYHHYYHYYYCIIIILNAELLSTTIIIIISDNEPLPITYFEHNTITSPIPSLADIGD